MTARVIVGDAVEQLRLLPDESVHCVVTSPPYWGLRDYGVVGQIGLEADFGAYVGELIAVFREVRRVLRADGTLWLNLGDSYTSGGRATYRSGASDNKGQRCQDDMPRPGTPFGLKPKDLVGVPWRVAFALQADGWWLRQDIIWSKPNPMPESVTDRCTKAHEYLFLLTKSERYWFDAEAIKELAVATEPGSFDDGPQKLPDGSTANAGRNYRPAKIKMPDGWDTGPGGHGAYHRNGREKGKTVELAKGFRGGSYVGGEPGPRVETGNTIAPDGFMRNKRSVWAVATAPFAEAHFATFPPALIEPCILAGCPKGGTVLDPFGGAGTTGLVADRLGRDAILIELNPDYAAMARRRIAADRGPLLEWIEAAQ